MANNTYKTRTNYVHITNQEKFHRILDRCATYNGAEIKIIEHKDENNEMTYGFYTYDDIDGYLFDKDGNIVENARNCDTDKEYKTNFEAFSKDLRTVIAPGDAMVITTIGNEGISRLWGSALVITHDKYGSIDLQTEAIQLAQEMLNNPNWNMQNEY